MASETTRLAATAEAAEIRNTWIGFMMEIVAGEVRRGDGTPVGALGPALSSLFAPGGPALAGLIRLPAAAEGFVEGDEVRHRLAIALREESSES